MTPDHREDCRCAECMIRKSRSNISRTLNPMGSKRARLAMYGLGDDEDLSTDDSETDDAPEDDSSTDSSAETQEDDSQPTDDTSDETADSSDSSDSSGESDSEGSGIDWGSVASTLTNTAKVATQYAQTGLDTAHKAGVLTSVSFPGAGIVSPGGQPLTSKPKVAGAKVLKPSAAGSRLVLVALALGAGAWIYLQKKKA